MSNREQGAPEPLPDETVEALLSEARSTRANAYAPYSHFGVGAAVLAGGRVFQGVNVENAAYPVGLCAERVAAGAAVTSGERELEAVAVVAPSETPSPPCGECRQFLAEFGTWMLVVAEGRDGARREWRLSELLPEAFDRSLLAE